MRRIELDIFIASHTGVNCKWITDFKAITGILKLLEENMGDGFMNLGKVTLAPAQVAMGPEVGLHHN